jgi:hypothetical protein
MRKLVFVGVGAAVAFGCVLVACVSSSSSPSRDAGTFDSGVFDAGNANDTGNDSAASPGDSGDASTITLTFASGTDWPSFDGDLGGSDGGSLGNAKTVCVAPGVPPSCPPGSVDYRDGGGGWTATVTAPGAVWIWRGDVVATGLSDLQFAVFEKTFTLGAHPSGTIQIAADDFVEVRVNGAVVGSAGSLTDAGAAFQGQSTATTLDLGPYLEIGTNTVTVVAQNGPQSYAGCATPCTFQENTAGVLFGGTLTSQ